MLNSAESSFSIVPTATVGANVTSRPFRSSGAIVNVKRSSRSTVVSQLIVIWICASVSPAGISSTVAFSAT